MVHTHHHALAGLLARREGTLDACHGQRERPLAQHVYAGAQCGRDVDLVQMVGCAEHDDIDVGVAQHFFYVVVGVFHLEARGERLRLADIVVADRRDFDTRQAQKHGQLRDLRNRARPKHADPNRIVHLGALFPAPCALLSLNRYMIPVRRLAALSPLDSVPRPSSVNRQAWDRLNSNPIVPLSPAVMTSRASSTKVPLIAAPPPLRTCTLIPVPMYAVTPCAWGKTYWKSTSPMMSLIVMRPRLIVSGVEGFTMLSRRRSNRSRA